jgi:DNA repair exonuclease SbcCD ATPase subunit
VTRTGVTQAQVDTAADTLLRGGERPTIERVRAVLGTGSPNTVVRLLEDWWSRLGARLSAVEAKLALPAAPAAVSKAGGEFWALALEHAGAIAAREVEADREAIETERRQLAQAAMEQDAAVADAKRREVEAVEAQAREAARCRDLEALVVELRSQVSELRQDRQEARDKVQQLESAVAGAAEELAQFRAESSQRVDALVAHAREVEDRAHAEVDRAREELKTTVKKVVQVERDAAHIKRDLNTQLREAREAKAAAEQEAGRVKGRLNALEERLVSFESLRALLERVQKEKGASRTKPRKNVRLPVKAKVARKTRAAKKS